ncbi:glycosyltransferase family 4 protein [Butyrivibrio sp. AE3004]|uniref:glycosyltransferase family 4 protein n=1 Tax=Butyrivibrio sp. AE3004 TaxID=1506994 RepID=UPI000494D3E8|nr:glycosyltransferase family 4 protein [Butyrivibrio sp. AE3004]
MRVVLHMGDPYTLENPCSKRMNVIAAELRKRNHDVVILAPDTPGVDRVEGVIYCKTPPLKRKTTINRLTNQVCLALSSLHNGKRIRDVDVVLTTCPPPLINIAGERIAKIHRAKLIYDVRDIWPDVALEMGSFSNNSIYAKVFAFIRNYMLDHADLITAVSDGKVEKLRKYNQEKKIINIPNGFNLSFYNLELNQDIYKNIKARGKTICTYVGNIGLAQGLEQLIYLAEKCLNEISSIQFLIYGSGAEEEKLRDYVSKKGLKNISFEGRLPNKDMRTVLEASDIIFVSLVNANLKDSVPTKLYEALGVGCPVFLVAEGDSVSILRDVNLGIDAIPNNKEDIWLKFKKMFYTLDSIKENKISAINKIHNEYSLQKSARIMVDEMEQMVSGDEAIEILLDNNKA